MKIGVGVSVMGKEEGVSVDIGVSVAEGGAEEVTVGEEVGEEMDVAEGEMGVNVAVGIEVSEGVDVGVSVKDTGLVVGVD